MDYFDWTAEAIDRLRALWDAGFPTSRIAQMMGTTKNAVVGKAGRLDLPSRASPIKTLGSGKQPRKGKAVGAWRKPSASTLSAASLPPPPAIAAPPPVPKVARVLVHQPEPQEPPTLFKPRASGDCCWPIGEPGTRGFRFCEAVGMPGKPYCAAHAHLAYIKKDYAA